jgi:hypothetical protein
LKQVFLTSRIYGGYANNAFASSSSNIAQCLNPEPFSYELGFTIQRAIVDQIDGVTNDYAGDVRYPQSAPWFDWGPYLWASGETLNSVGIRWCNGQGDAFCASNQKDVRFGDSSQQSTYYGDWTHPTAQGQFKVANQLVNWITGQKSTLGVQGFITDWVTPWIPTN